MEKGSQINFSVDSLSFYRLSVTTERDIFTPTLTKAFLTTFIVSVIVNLEDRLVRADVQEGAVNVAN